MEIPMTPITRAFAAALAAAVFASPAALADEPYPSTLVGQSVLPAATFVPAPADAPASLSVSGKYTAPDGKRVDAVGSIPGTSFAAAKEAPRKTGMATPFDGQPVQGFSGIKPAGDGSYWLIQDNGFGAKANSPDAMLMIQRVRPDFETGKTAIEETVFLSDPGKVIPYRIATEASDTRYLTGADLDTEALQPVGDSFFVGDELGPFLVEFGRDGKAKAFYETKVNGALVRSPDHPALTPPAAPTGKFAFTVRRSRGFEGMAASPDGKMLYPLLEGGLWIEEAQGFETIDGKEVLRVLEFDVEKRDWTGRSWAFPVETAGNSIGDFNMIDERTALIIERDNNEGAAAMACKGDDKGPDCFITPAALKRIYKVELADDGMARKIGYIDLLSIDDPDGKAHQGGADGRFDFPFVTIENVAVVDGSHIIVGNDNNLPFSAGRKPQQQDDNELILLAVPELLQAK
jgi:hypothetical protein